MTWKRHTLSKNGAVSEYPCLDAEAYNTYAKMLPAPSAQKSV